MVKSVSKVVLSGVVLKTIAVPWASCVQCSAAINAMSAFDIDGKYGANGRPS